GRGLAPQGPTCNQGRGLALRGPAISTHFTALALGYPGTPGSDAPAGRPYLPRTPSKPAGFNHPRTLTSLRYPIMTRLLWERTEGQSSCAKFVAQIANLLYRSLEVFGPSERTTRPEFSRSRPSRTICRLEICDTADWKSALLYSCLVAPRRFVL